MNASIIVLGIFFLSGISGLVYQVIWVRLFGNVFGNTVYSAAAITAVFMLGLGLGSYLIGRWGDRLFRRDPAMPLRLYGWAEFLIGGWCLGVALILPQLTKLSAWGSTYVAGPEGWFELSLASLVLRYAIALLLLAPPTLLMGGTLTLLIRFTVAHRLDLAGWRVGLLYGANTLGAATGCLLTDLVLVRELGIFNTQLVAVGLNWLAGGIAMAIVARTATTVATAPAPVDSSTPPTTAEPVATSHLIPRTVVALFLSGFAALGLEIVWFRLLVSLLGGYRAAFSIVLGVVLLGIFAGALIGGAANRRWGRPALLYVITQGAFATTTALMLILYSGDFLRDYALAIEPIYREASETGRWLLDLWANLRVTLLLVGIPAICMGFTFPLGNALVQRSDSAVGGRAGLLYLSNTAGNVAGALCAGFVFLTLFGSQTSLLIFAACAALSAVPLYPLIEGQSPRARRMVLGLSLGVALLAMVGFRTMPSDYLLESMFEFSKSKKAPTVIATNEGINETLMITEGRGGRTLHTNGHAMSSTFFFIERYMRAAAHIPLLQIDQPRRVLNIAFGAGNTLNAASLHPTVERLEVADLSRSILEHADYFTDANQGVLADPRTQVFVNDGRHHLLMQEPESYDLITLEPPPMNFAGTAALYTREFYELARSRLRRGGFMSQWLPANQLPGDVTLSLVKAFIEVFPESVLLCGARQNMNLLGINGDSIELDIDRVAANLAARPRVREDLRRIRMGTPTELVGSFASSKQTMRRITEHVEALVDDLPSNEYASRSNLQINVQPAAIYDVSDAADWCPECFSEGNLGDALADLPAYLDIMQQIYSSTSFLVEEPRRAAPTRINSDAGERRRAVERSPFLRSLLQKRTASSPAPR